MSQQGRELRALVDGPETALASAHAAQTAALAALRQLAEQAAFRPGGRNWDWELDGSGFEGIPTDLGIPAVKEAAALLRVSEGSGHA
jgi:hypothetical protein